MKVIAFDTETRGLVWADPAERAFMYTWSDGEGEYAARENDEAGIARFVDALKSADKIVGHNLAFDTHHVREALGLDILQLDAELHDTAMLSRVIHPSGQQLVSHKLKDLAQKYLRADAAEAEEAIAQVAKDIGLKTLNKTNAYYEVDQARPDLMEKYAKLDAKYTYELYAQFAPQLNGQQRVYDLEMQVMPILIRAEQRGIKVDQDKVQELKAEYESALAEVTEWLERELETPEGIEGGNLAGRLMEGGVPLKRKTPTGALRTDVFALADFEDDYPVIGKLQEFRRLRKFLSTYIGAFDGLDVVHPSFWQAEARTGRMSCSRPNLQNLPKRAGKEVRAVLVPRDGYAFVVRDYESIESRLLAYYLADDGYRELVEKRDPHAWMAAQIHGGEVRDYVKGTPGEAERAVAKNTTFAVTYGAGKRRVADMNKISQDEAERLIGKLKNSLPNWYQLQRRIKTKAATVGRVNTVLGRTQLVSHEKAYMGLNSLVQGSAADIFKLGLVAVDEAVRDLGAVPLLFVHDEIVVECPVDHAKECARRMDLAMTQPGRDLGLKPQLSVEGSITEESYADA